MHGHLNVKYFNVIFFKVPFAKVTPSIFCMHSVFVQATCRSLDTTARTTRCAFAVFAGLCVLTFVIEISLLFRVFRKRKERRPQERRGGTLSGLLYTNV